MLDHQKCARPLFKPMICGQFVPLLTPPQEYDSAFGYLILSAIPFGTLAAAMVAGGWACLGSGVCILILTYADMVDDGLTYIDAAKGDPQAQAIVQAMGPAMWLPDPVPSSAISNCDDIAELVDGDIAAVVVRNFDEDLTVVAIRNVDELSEFTDEVVLHVDDEIVDMYQPMAQLDFCPTCQYDVPDIRMQATSGQAKRALQQGADEVTVATRQEAEQLLYEVFLQDEYYRNTTGMTSTEANRFWGGREGTYHWDEDLSGHLNEAHARLPHVQIHTYDGDIIRIYFEKGY